MCGRPCGHPQTLGGLLLQLGPHAQTGARSGGGRARSVRVVAEGPAQVSSPAVPDKLAQGVSEAGRSAQPV